MITLQAEGDVAARKVAEDLLSEAYWDTEEAKVGTILTWILCRIHRFGCQY